jgi:hypothetical protein
MMGSAKVGAMVQLSTNARVLGNRGME